MKRSRRRTDENQRAIRGKNGMGRLRSLRFSTALFFAHRAQKSKGVRWVGEDTYRVQVMITTKAGVKA